MSSGDLPQMRASDADRERVAETLRQASGDGRLTVEELDERLDATYAARTVGDLETLTVDLVPAGPVHDPSSGARLMPVAAGAPGTKWLLSIMSGRDRKGHWRVGERLLNVNLMGGSDLDLNDAELASHQTEIRIVSIMGGADVHVPDGLDVTVSELAIMGGNDVHLGQSRPLPGSPKVHIKVFSLMGGTTITRGRRLTRREKRERRELERRRDGG